MSTFSTDLKIELIGTGEQSGTWGTTTNENFSNVFEQALVGRVNVAFTDANVTLSQSDSVTSQSFRRLYLNCTGTNSASRNLIVPTINKTYVVQNNTTGGFAIVVKTSAGTGVTVPNGKSAAVYVNGTDVVQAFDYFTSLDVGTLTASAGTITGLTTVDTTNLEVTNIKAKDGTAAGSIADSTGLVTLTNLTGTTADYTNLEVTNIKAKDGTANISIADTTGIATFSKATVISGTDNTNAMLRITQEGSGNALLVEDEANPDSSPFVINADGRVISGTTAALTGAESIVPRIATYNGQFGTFRYLNDTSGNIFIFNKSRGTGTTQTVVQNADSLGVVTFAGSDGTSFIPAARISADVDGTPGTNDMPGRLLFSTTADGASSPTERMRITNGGQVGIATTSPGSALDVKGTFRLSGSSSGYVGLAPAASAGSTTYTLPSADGTNGQVLQTNGSGTLSWTTAGGITTGKSIAMAMIFGF